MELSFVGSHSPDSASSSANSELDGSVRGSSGRASSTSESCPEQEMPVRESGMTSAVTLIARKASSCAAASWPEEAAAAAETATLHCDVSSSETVAGRGVNLKHTEVPHCYRLGKDFE